jgi:hypothetical protein
MPAPNLLGNGKIGKRKKKPNFKILKFLQKTKKVFYN